MWCRALVDYFMLASKRLLTNTKVAGERIRLKAHVTPSKYIVWSTHPPLGKQRSGRIAVIEILSDIDFDSQKIYQSPRRSQLGSLLITHITIVKIGSHICNPGARLHENQGISNITYTATLRIFRNYIYEDHLVWAHGLFKSAQKTFID